MKFCFVLFAVLGIWMSYGQSSAYQAIDTIACDVPARDVALGDDVNPFAIVEYLNSGGTVTGLTSHLLERNRIGRRVDANAEIPIPNWARNRGGSYLADVDQNGYVDVVVAIGFAEPGGGIYVFGCERDHYVMLPISFDDESCIDNCGSPPAAPRITFIGDMNGDNFPEIVYDFAWSGVTTVWMDIHVMAWSSETGSIVQFTPKRIEYPAGGCASVQIERELYDGTYIVSDTNNDGLLELIVQTGCSGSGIASGPQRSQQLTFGWNGDYFVEIAYLPDPPTFRLHAVYDAVYALNHINPTIALSLYDRVLTDETLRNWSSHNIGWIVTSHALYGKLLSTIALYGYTSNQAIQAYEYVIEIAESTDLLDTLWVEIASLLWTTINDTENLATACEIVNEALSLAVNDAPPHLYGLNIIGYWPQFGYNINWIPTDRNLSMCPF